MPLMMDTDGLLLSMLPALRESPILVTSDLNTLKGDHVKAYENVLGCYPSLVCTNTQMTLGFKEVHGRKLEFKKKRLERLWVRLLVHWSQTWTQTMGHK